jgi:hypothetical protein
MYVVWKRGLSKVTANVTAFCCADILWFVSRNCCWPKLQKIRTYSVAGIYSFSPDRWWLANRDDAYIFVSQHSRKPPVIGSRSIIGDADDWPGCQRCPFTFYPFSCSLKLSMLQKYFQNHLRHRSNSRPTVAVHVLKFNQGTTQKLLTG